MRLGEARNLELQDINLTAAILTIRGAKLGKSRYVPMHASTCKVLGGTILHDANVIGRGDPCPPTCSCLTSASIMRRTSSRSVAEVQVSG
ncbi:hypothetical protein [Cupriavidus metallidurans]|uniref:hypothetical protein n=1 Tax=Cupriavidus metallidurans TaxID=119219 RepID=UPI003B3A8983